MNEPAASSFLQVDRLGKAFTHGLTKLPVLDSVSLELTKGELRREEFANNPQRLLEELNNF